MRAFEQNPKASQQATPANSPTSSRDMNSNLPVQRTLGNQASERNSPRLAFEPSARIVDRAPTLPTHGPLATRLERSRSNGRPLPSQARSMFEPKFGIDFSSVRVHTNQQAHEMATVLSARAFTWGNHIYFRHGEWQPTSPNHSTLAHELAHVVQQSSQASPRINRLAEPSTTHGRQPATPSGNQGSMARVYEVALSIAQRLTEIAEAPRLVAQGAAADRAEAQARDAVKGATSSLDRSSGPIALLPDVQGHTISAAAKAYLIGFSIPLWHTIVASPTLRPYTVEQAARAGTLTNFNAHPGSSFLGAVGEAIVWSNLGAWPIQNAVRGAIYVFPNPGTGAIALSGLDPATQQVAASLLGTVSPDLLAVMFGLRGEIQTQHHLVDVVPPGRTGVQRDYSFLSGQTVLAFIEVTTTTQWRFIEQRGLRVAAWAGALASHRSGTLRAIAVLAIDRGAYFQLSVTERDSLVRTVAGAGGFILLQRGLTSQALQQARGAASGI